MKKIILALCVLAFGLNANAQMRRVGVDMSQVNSDAARTNIPATGTSDDDKPNVTYTRSFDGIITIGEIKKIITDYTVQLGYDAPTILLVEDYYYVSGEGKERRNWKYTMTCPSEAYPGKRVVSFFVMEQKRSVGGIWETNERVYRKSRIVPGDYTLPNN